MGDADYPATMAEAVLFLRGLPATEALVELYHKLRDALRGLNFSDGILLRKRLGLWQHNQALLRDCGIFDPDEASIAILEALWDDLQKNPPANPSPPSSDTSTSS